MPRYIVHRMEWDLTYLESQKIEAGSGKEALAITQGDADWFESRDPSIDVAVQYERVYPVNKDGDCSPDEVYELNGMGLVDMGEPREHFLLTHPKGWRHS